ncbi:hypothetical protein TWF173_010140 [Orbilia oligospora]|uniref:Large ribosomal subunit protein mL54 n=2 Tax=Orbilia oligospora TaxID=2813651 RepID=G1X4L8_ARTOA|nr:hypothetical protein AOL_s00043g642 [Orbilia oligospora ATCC 24927]KAF3158673.1 hypothetical protein TWF751_001320 [Orbilia oligospora]EGX51908.1 hypothetical protein AOL_s00043g642 [Orbilia oligospora ATCC 24927]KAF3178243.1 hypothetical protein TWF225_007998 [Orbilia oligospora]KAF3236167.1 hypothetical protein TWF128_001460 [Orbilia oligospora]KAF3247493.1 hypothetical protein TWF217_009649 [Orbilia oligospora]
MSVCIQCAFRHGFRSTRAVAPRLSASSIVPVRRFISTSISPQKEKPSDATTTTEKPKVVSITPAGTIMKGINFNKKLKDPIALPDEEYPAWLWTILEDRRPILSSAPQLSSEDAADLYSKSKGRRKLAQKRIAAKQAAASGELVTPADYKTEDMPWQTFEESQAAIYEAKKASRERRRAAIKEKNFLGKLG